MKELHTNMWSFENNISEEDCKYIISYFDEHNNQKIPGYINSGFSDDSVKKSTDMLIKPNIGDDHIVMDAILSSGLQKAFKQLEQSNDICVQFLGQGYDTGYQIQMTLPGQGYDYHSDEWENRLLTFLWYLNDDFDGGTTHFPKQDINVVPKTGTLLIFPAYWTHVHAGLPVISGTKYIATGWMYRHSSWYTK